MCFRAFFASVTRTPNTFAAGDRPHAASFAAGARYAPKLPSHRNISSHDRLYWASCYRSQENYMNGIIYLVGLVVVVLFILSFLGLR